MSTMKRWNIKRFDSGWDFEGVENEEAISLLKSRDINTYDDFLKYTNLDTNLPSTTAITRY